VWYDGAKLLNTKKNWHTAARRGSDWRKRKEQVMARKRVEVP